MQPSGLPGFLGVQGALPPAAGLGMSPEIHSSGGEGNTRWRGSAEGAHPVLPSQTFLSPLSQRERGPGGEGGSIGIRMDDARAALHDFTGGEPSTEAAVQGEGRYIYCVADSGESASLGQIGLASSEVHTVPYRDICAVVHSCAAEPYQSSYGEVVKEWVMTHQRVVDTAWERWGTVLPLGFNTIIRGDAGTDAEQSVRRWLEEDYESLGRKMAKVGGKAEYGIQIFWDPKVIAKSIAATSPEIGKLEQEIRSKPKGLAYMYRQRLENLLKREMEAKADQCFKECYGRIREHVTDIRVEKTKKADPAAQMLMNLSCLVSIDGFAKLGEELEKIATMQGFSVRFTGPWPPYSFVGSA